MPKYSYEFKLKVVQSYLSEEGSDEHLAKKYGKHQKVCIAICFNGILYTYAISKQKRQSPLLKTLSTV